MSKRLPIAAALCAAAILPAAADAAEYDYRVTYDIAVTHTRESAAAEVDHKTTSKTALRERLVGDYGVVTFQDGRLVRVAVDAPVAVTPEGTFTGTYVSKDVTDKTTCTAGAPDMQGYGSFVPDPAMPQAGGPLVARLSNVSATTWSCVEGLGLAPSPKTYWYTGADVGAGPLDATFTLPSEALGSGRFVQRVTGPSAAAGDFCPGDDDDTYACSIAFDGALTFEKVAERGVVVAPPAVAKPPVVVPPVNRPAPAAPVPAPAAPTSARAASVDGRGRLTLRTTCPAGCSGKGTLKVRGKRFAVRFSVPAGGERRVRVKLGAKARKALRRARRGTLTLRLTPPSGATVTRTVTVRAAR